MLPNLAALARGAREAGEPTGTSLDDVPEEVLQLVIKHLVAKNAGEWDSVCRDLETWCRVRPIACTSPELWKGAFEAAFGPLVDVNKGWDKRDFEDVYPGLPLSNPLPYDAMFKATCKLFTRFDRPSLRNVANWTDAMLDKKLAQYAGGYRPAFTVGQFLKMRGANLDRRTQHQRLKSIVLKHGISAQSVTDAQRLLANRGNQLDPNYVIPVDTGPYSYQPHSLLHELLISSSLYGVHTYQLAEVLLQHKADPNGVDVNGDRPIQTTLHLVIENGIAPASNALAMFKLLLKYGADLTREDPVHGTPRQSLAIKSTVYHQARFRDMLGALDAEIAKRATDAAGATGAAPRS